MTFKFLNAWVSILCMIVMGLAVTSCDQTRHALGLERSQPDEFSVLERPPLSVPPSLHLKPPVTRKTGEPEARAIRQKAENLVLKPKPSLGTQSAAETTLLQKAGADQAQTNVREMIDQETNVDKSVEDLGQKLLFWQDPKPQGDVIDPVEERKKLAQEKKESRESKGVSSSPSGSF